MSPDLPPDLTSRFQIVGLLGEGGMGVVYRVFQADLNRDAALKVLKSFAAQDLDRFVREGQILATLTHPGILRVFDAGLEAGVPYILSEVVEVPTLGERLRAGDLEMTEITQIVRGLGSASRAFEVFDVPIEVEDPPQPKPGITAGVLEKFTSRHVRGRNFKLTLNENSQDRR